jgi:hypothetical protein
LNLPTADPRELERLGNEVPDSELARVWTITTNPEDIVKKVQSAVNLGYDEIQLHSASPSEEVFLEMCDKELLPSLKEKEN